ncbi:MAG: hypothetical protein HY840_06455 [Bacteroidetes bacterium]|nr:hypothetical protein [Bacteroidota bacterium]
MTSPQQTGLENFTLEEKKRIADLFRKEIILKHIIYLFLIGGSVFIIVYFNRMNSSQLCCGVAVSV